MVKLTKEVLKEMLKWSSPLLGVELLLFLIFYIEAAFLFLFLGFIMTIWYSMLAVYWIRQKIINR
jgi:hypothetical protein